MTLRLFIAAVLTGCLIAGAEADEEPLFPFADGRWRGEFKAASNSSDHDECWASTSFDEGTTLTLARQKGRGWNLKLSNANWQLNTSRPYSMSALVDFYPKLRLAAKGETRTLLQISDLEYISLLGLLENGHSITLTSDGFDKTYDLEGSAKVIQRMRGCFSDP
jgi:hypothetical protein